MSDIPSISVIVADDHPIIRRHICTQLESQRDMALVGEGGDGESAMQLIRDMQPQVAILDVNMPLTAKSAYPPFCLLDSLQQIKSFAPETIVIILSQEDDTFLINKSIRMGVRGYLLKSDALSADLPLAIRLVSGGGHFFSESVGTHLQFGENGAAQEIEGLSRRQLEILNLVAAHPDQSYASLAESLQIAESTLKSHLGSVYRRLGVGTKSAAIMKGIEQGIVKVNQPGRSYHGAGNET